MRARYLCIAVLPVLLAGARQADAQLVTGNSTATGVSRSFNPAISVNALFLGTYLSGEAGDPWELEKGMRLQEGEMQFTSFVDPYFKADLVAAFADGEAAIEQVFLTSQALPFGWTARFGQFLAPFGKHNQLHTHQFPFVEPPMVNTYLFGGEGLNEFGAELSYLFPTPFYLQATGALLNGDNAFFAPDSTDALAGLARVNALWDLSESTTLELGASWLGGESGWASKNGSVTGGDMTLKWRPLRRSLYTQAELQVEYLRGSRLPETGANEAWGGLTSHIRYRFNRSWWASGRWEKIGIPDGGMDPTTRYSAQLAWVPGEFELWRIQYSHTAPEAPGAEPFTALFLQTTFTIGSHPAHKY